MQFTIKFGTTVKRYFVGQEASVRYNLVQNPATSEVNDFIPYHALLTGRLVGVGNHRTLLYDLNIPKQVDYSSKQYETFVTGFLNDIEWKKFIKKGTDKQYRVRAGQLVEIDKDMKIIPLLTLVVNKAHMLDINKENPDRSKFFIIIDKAFKHESHKSMFLAFKKYLFEVYTGVYSIQVDSITGFCYKSMAVEPRKPKSIVEAKSMGKDLTIEVMKHLIYG